jgi:flagellar biogenesis protein FliO
MRSGRPRTELACLAFTLVPAAALAADGDAVPGLGEMALRAGLSLAAVLALIVALAVLVRRLRTPRAAASSSRRVVPLDRLDLGSRREIRLLRVEDRLVLLGVTGDRIALLSDLPAGAEDVRGEGSDPGGLRLLSKLTNSS